MHPTRFWTELAINNALLHHAWAVRELDPYTEIDELCVELEVITGQSASSLRGELLLGAMSVLPFHSTSPERAEYFAQDDARLGLWVVCGLLRELRVTEGTVFAGFKDDIRRIAANCITKEPNADLVAMRWAMSEYSMRTWSQTGREIAYALMRSIDIALPGDAISDSRAAGEAARAIFRNQSFELPETASTIIKRCVMTFPVATTPWRP